MDLFGKTSVLGKKNVSFSISGEAFFELVMDTRAPQAIFCQKKRNRKMNSDNRKLLFGVLDSKKFAAARQQIFAVEESWCILKHLRKMSKTDVF